MKRRRKSAFTRSYPIEEHAMKYILYKDSGIRSRMHRTFGKKATKRAINQAKETYLMMGA